VKLAAAIAAVGAVAAIVVSFAVPDADGPVQAVPHGPQHHRSPFALRTSTGSYIGLYADGVPESYAGVTAFTAATGVKPSLVLYYSGWPEPFQASFATTVADKGGVLLVQMNPRNISVAAIASGQYDGYLNAYAKAVRAYHHPVILGFGHEMNGYWYSWGYQNTPPGVFVAAWRHIVTLFRAAGADNVTWMWTINTIHPRARVPSPGPWWPGSSYVNWVGIDGYYFNSSSSFAPVFGPTIAAVRRLTSDPILIAETSAVASSSQADQIANLFAGIRLYGLLGLVWFDSVHTLDWRLTGSASIASFRRNAETYHGPEP
jgi:mannan endo-1,4-beta-mannosidase